MISDFQKARIVQLRGLGYQQKEIAEMLGLSQAQVAYHLQEFKRLSNEKGFDSVYLDIMLSGLGPEAMKFIAKLDELRKRV